MYTVYASQSIETDEPEIIRLNQTHHLGMLAPCAADTTTLPFVVTSHALIDL